ncbi:hypothetical protein WA577_002037 [Blastocystis sp. JDR]
MGCYSFSDYSVCEIENVPSLRLLEVGDYSFAFVNEVKLIGLNQLERVVIGKNSFKPSRFGLGDNPARHFHLKNCERLRELKIGRYSFSDYSVCEIENVPSLEVIEMGELNEESNNFCDASLELKNLPSLKSLLFGNRAFCLCSRAVFENLPELTSIQLGKDAFQFNGDDSSELIMRNLPKLTTLTTGKNSCSFNYPGVITLENIPSLTTVSLPHAFEYRHQLSLKNVGAFIKHPAFVRNPHANIHSVDELRAMSPSVEVIIVDHNACNEKCFTALVLSLFSNLKVLEVGDHSFSFVEEVELIGLSHLEMVVIGKNSFTGPSRLFLGDNPARHFHLKNCERLRELKMGCYSFSDYSVCEIENVPSLRLLEVGDYSFAFVNEVKLIGLNQLERVVIGKNSFTKPNRFCLGDNPSRHFYLKNCERLRELKIGRYSFSDYSVCEIENVPSLEVIEMGELNEESNNFCDASLELKNLPSLKSLLFGNRAFCLCSRAVFENLPELTSIQLGKDAFQFNGDDSSELIMRNLPKLTSLIAEGDYSNTFCNPRYITLKDMPSLTTVTLGKYNSFSERITLHTKNITPALKKYLKYPLSSTHDSPSILSKRVILIS